MTVLGHNFTSLSGKIQIQPSSTFRFCCPIPHDLGFLHVWSVFRKRYNFSRTKSFCTQNFKSVPGGKHPKKQYMHGLQKLQPLIFPKKVLFLIVWCGRKWRCNNYCFGVERNNSPVRKHVNSVRRRQHDSHVFYALLPKTWPLYEYFRA